MDNKQLKKDFKTAQRIIKRAMRFEIQYIQIKTNNGKMSILATDSIILFKKEYNDDMAGWNEQRTLYLPADGVDLFIENDFVINDKTIRLFATDISYPDISALKTSNKITLVVNTEDIRPILKAFKTISRLPTIQFRAKGNKLVIWTNTLKAKIKLLDSKTPYQHFCLNADYLLYLIDDGQFTCFNFNGANNPIMINDSVIMPVKTN